MCPATRSGKACEIGRGRKTPQERGGRPTYHVSCKQTHQLARAAALPNNQEQESLKKKRWEENSTGRWEDPLPM
jgi:hypothetical protein